MAVSGEQQHRDIVERWFGELFTRGDLAALDELLTPDFVAHGPGESGDTHGSEGFAEWLRWYLNTFTDREWTVHDVISAGDKVVARYSGRTTYRGGWLGIPSNNERVLETGILIYRVEGGRVKELWSEMSDLPIAAQLGALRAPEQSAE